MTLSLLPPQKIALGRRRRNEKNTGRVCFETAFFRRRPNVGGLARKFKLLKMQFNIWAINFMHLIDAIVWL